MSDWSLPWETERLLLRRERLDDAEILHALWSERDERVPPHRRISADGRPTVADLAAQISAALESGPTLLMVERKDTGATIGYCGLVVSDDDTAQEPEIAYELLRSAHGSGYATEAASAVLFWASGLGYQRLRATVRDWNLASLSVLAKLSFEGTGEIEPDDGYGDSLILERLL